jgi:hypothetical protein
MVLWPVALHVLVLLFFGWGMVATPLPLNFAALFVWAFVVWKWGTSWLGSHPQAYVNVPLLTQLFGMSAIVLLSAFAPGKIVEQQKARRIALPRQEMTVAELQSPMEHGLDRFYRFSMSASDELAHQRVQFPARELTVDEFIGAIEAQTPLRHRFHHCGNGRTILWGGDCSFGLHFNAPRD